ncbi:putative membrane protein [Neofusicoccum parvum]|nr:putative membrane protein [Neofusicoccum parvum]
MASAYISDCVDEEKRNVEVGRMHGAMFIGIAVGPAMSSAIIAGSGQKSPLLVFYIGIAMRVASLVYLMVFVSESLPQARKGFRSAFSMPSTTRWQHITRPAKGIDAILAKLDKVNPSKWLDRLLPPGTSGSRRMRRNVIILIAINIICYAGAMATGEVLILYPQVVFKWGNVENNMFMSVINGFRAAVSTLAIPFLIAIFRKRKPQFGRHSEPTHDHPLPHPSSAPVPTSTTSPSTMLDPSAFPDLDALTSPTTPQATTFPPSDPDSPLALRSITTTTPAAPQPATGSLDPLDRTLILTALLFDIFGYIGYALSPNGILFTLCGAAAAFGAVGLSTSEAALTKCVQPSAAPRRRPALPQSKVGELMAGLGMLQSVVRIVAPALVNVVYAATVEGRPGTAFLGVAGVLGVGVGLTAVLVVG